jgi:hypothetical protein
MVNRHILVAKVRGSRHHCRLISHAASKITAQLICTLTFGTVQVLRAVNTALSYPAYLLRTFDLQTIINRPGVFRL